MAHGIKRGILIEDMVEEFPQTVQFMIGKGLPCFVCGEPTLGTFEEMARRHGKTELEIDTLIEEI